jgi:hypothetical protein
MAHEPQGYLQGAGLGCSLRVHRRDSRLGTERLSFRHREARGGSSGEHVYVVGKAARRAARTCAMPLVMGLQSMAQIALASIRCHPTGGGLR